VTRHMLAQAWCKAGRLERMRFVTASFCPRVGQVSICSFVIGCGTERVLAPERLTSRLVAPPAARARFALG